MYNINMDISMIFLVVFILLFSLTIHEIAHGFMAYKLGDDTAKIAGRLTFNPLAHLEPFMSIVLPLICVISGAPVIGGAKPVPVNPRKFKNEDMGMALVALAGPASNFIMATLAYGVLMVFNVNHGFLAIFLAYFTRINLGLMLFNLLPIPPLDGSKIIFPFAPDFVRNIIRKLERDPMMLFVVILIFSNHISNAIGLVSSEILSFLTLIFK